MIRNTIARNNHALDDCRYEECVLTYAADGVIAGRKGHAAIREFINGQHLATDPELQRRHINTNIANNIHADLADATSDLLVHDKVANGPWTLTAVGRYHDQSLPRV